MMMTEKPNPRLADCDAQMAARFEEALALVQKLFAEADNYLENGRPAGPDFDRTFEG